MTMNNIPAAGIVYVVPGIAPTSKNNSKAFAVPALRKNAMPSKHIAAIMYDFFMLRTSFSKQTLHQYSIRVKAVQR
jgi:hypothetical protein